MDDRQYPHWKGQPREHSKYRIRPFSFSKSGYGKGSCDREIGEACSVSARCGYSFPVL